MDAEHMNNCLHYRTAVATLHQYCPIRKPRVRIITKVSIRVTVKIRITFRLSIRTWVKVIVA